jgi:AbrB family looped-hinge helix DNA binding protein
MKEILVPIDKAGRVVLPKSIRDDLAISPGDVFKISVAGNILTLEADKRPTGLIRKGKSLVFSSRAGAILTHETVQELMDEERGEPITQVAKRLPKRKR